MKKVIEQLTEALELLDNFDESNGRISGVKAIIENCIDEIRAGKKEVCCGRH